MYAGVWKRFFAAVIDQTLYSVVYTVWLIILFPQKGLNLYESILDMLHEGQISGLIYQHILFPLIALWLYNTLFECSSMQGTLGKALLGIKVTDRRGDRIGFFKAAIRSLCKYFIVPLSNIGYLLVLFTKKKQALHDILSGTLVVQSTYVKVDRQKDLEAELLKALDEGKIKTYNDFLKQKQELLNGIKKKAI